MRLTSAEIMGKIEALDVALADWECEADEKSLAAVAGEPEAGKKLAEINQFIEHAKADRIVLERALVKASEAEAKAKADAEAEARARHLGAARSHASSLLETARRIDAMTADFAAALADLAQAQAGIRSSLAAARALPDDGIVGRRNIEGIAVEGVLKLVDGRRKLRQDDRGVADIAEVAWRFLIEADEQEAA